jgi:hypothetical protein
MLKRKNYNLKLPREFQKRFYKPYANFVIELLLIADEELIKNCSSNQSKVRKNYWMVGLTFRDGKEFRKRKLEVMPFGTNAQFVEVLLLAHEARSGIQKIVVDNHGTPSDNNRMLDQSILKFNPSKIKKRVENIKLIANRASYKMNGVELLTSPTVQ